MEKKIVTFGEVLLRFSKNDHLRLSQGSRMMGNYGGSEANAAVSLAMFGNRVEYVTRVPDNTLGRAALMRLREYGLNVDHVCMGGNRLGTYYFEEAAAVRNSKVVYDRKDSSFYSMQPGMIPWREVFADAHLFHCSGITCAVSQSAQDTTFEAVRTADEMGLTIACDINYRKNLWNYGAKASEVLHRLMQYSDFVFGDQNEWEVVSGLPHIPFEALDADYELNLAAYEEYFAQLHKQFPRCGQMLMGLRNQITTSHHTLSGILWSAEGGGKGKLYTTRIYNIDPVIDPMGVGDAFVAGFLHARGRWGGDLQRCLDFSLAASQLKNSVTGDFNLVTEDEVLEQMENVED